VLNNITRRKKVMNDEKCIESTFRKTVKYNGKWIKITIDNVLNHQECDKVYINGVETEDTRQDVK
jgi:hypothetical protein